MIHSIENRTEYLNEDIQALLAASGVSGCHVRIETVRAYGTPAKSMESYHWQFSSYENRLTIKLMSRRRLEDSLTSLERLASPDHVSYPPAVLQHLVQSLLRRKQNNHHYDSFRPFNADELKPIPADFKLMLRMPTVPAKKPARVFETSEVEDDLRNTRYQLTHARNCYAQRELAFAKERDAALAKIERKIALLERRLEKAQKRAARES